MNLSNRTRRVREKEGWELLAKTVALREGAKAPKLPKTKVFIACTPATKHFTDLSNPATNKDVAYTYAYQFPRQVAVNQVVLRSFLALGSNPQSVRTFHEACRR